VSLVSVYVVVRGPVYERYAATLVPQLEDLFLPGETEVVVLAGAPGWPNGSASRYQVALENIDRLSGDWIFQIDADMVCLAPVGREILAAGLTVTTHPGYPPGTPEEECPYERRPESRACVREGEGRQYHPGAFVGGPRDEFLEMAQTLMGWYADDASRGLRAVWYDESYLNRYLLDRPPALVLDKRYCWWQFWPERDGAILMHLDKTPDEVKERDRG
jgi:hypothetical protein